jgi:hypothetical protein
MYFYSFTIISPWRRAIPFLWTNLNPLHPRMICAKSCSNWSSGSGEEVENVKIYRRTDRQTDAGQWAIRKAHLSFQLRWAKKYFSRTTGLSLTRLGTNRPWGKGIQVCSKEGDNPFPRGDNSKREEKKYTEKFQKSSLQN